MDMINFNTIQEFDDTLGVETLHPLVSIVDLSKSKMMSHMRHTMSFYAIFLKDEKNCEMIYGNTKYDYNKGSVVCLSPGQVIGIESDGSIFQPQGWGLFFDVDLIHGTDLGRRIKDYHFFSYEVNEALHLSEQERETFVGCLNMIQTEILHSIDKMSKKLIASYLGILLDYCQRFYDRQFITRENINSDILVRFEKLLNDYFKGDNAYKNGLPTVAWAASELCLSANYFGDLLKKEVGKTPQEIIHLHILDAAKEALANDEHTITEISDSLGFQYPQHFCRFIKKEIGMTPAQYRKKQTI